MIDEKIKIFISYSWDDDEHVQWVSKLAGDLESFEEIHVVLDQYDLNNFSDKNHFMEQSVYDSNIILIVCTEKYAIKADDRQGGVGIETRMAIVRHLEEMERDKKSNIIAILRGEKEKSIPRYLKDKIYISFKDNEHYKDSLNQLLKEIKSQLQPTSIRPPKTRSLTAKQIRNFQFNRVDDILAINYKKRELIESETDYKGKNEIKYEYWKVTNLNKSTFILTLFNYVNIKETIERFIKKQQGRIPKELIIFRANKGRIDYIQNIFDTEQISTNVTEYTIEQFVWEECIDQDWKKENRVVEEEFFIDQKVYKGIENDEEECGLSLEYIERKFLYSDNNNGILMIFASGGMGKSTLSEVLTNKINSRDDKKALLIQSEIIRDKIKNDAMKNFAIQNLYQLYDIYIKMISEHKSLLSQKQFELGVLTGKIIVIIDGLDEIISLFQSSFNLGEFLESLEDLNNQLGKAKVVITSRLNVFQTNKEFYEEFADTIFFKGFDEDVWKQYVHKRFAKYGDTNRYLNKVNKYLGSILEPSQSAKKVILPFFLDLICEVVEEEINTENSNFIINNLQSYLTNHESIDYLIQAIINRERTRQRLENVSIKSFISLYEELATNYGGKWSLENLHDCVEYVFSSNDYEDIYKKVLLNPLIKVDQSSGTAQFKYDFLANYFNSLYLMEIFSLNKIDKLDQSAMKVLSKLYDGTHPVLGEIVKYFSSHKTECLNSIGSFLKLIRKQLKSNGVQEQESKKLKQVISSLMYLAQKIYGESLDRNKRREILEKLYGKTKIQDMYIWGDFFPIDYSNLEIWSSEFYEYSSLCKSKFTNTKFYHSRFTNILPTLKCELTKDNFDLESCTLDLLDDYIEGLENKQVQKQKIIEDEFKKLCRNFYNGVNFESKAGVNLTIPNIFKKINIIDLLIKMNFLEKEEKLLKPYYRITSQHQRSVKNLFGNNFFDAKLRGILSQLN